MLLGALNWSQTWYRAGQGFARRCSRAVSCACCASRSTPDAPHPPVDSIAEPAPHGHPPKVLITKIGLDGHDRGSRIVAAHLRDAGMEVVYTPPWQEIRTVVKLALEEDVDVIGVSSLATDHLIVPKLMAALREAGLDRRRGDRRRHRARRGRADAARRRRGARVPSGRALEDISPFVREATAARARRALPCLKASSP